MAVLLMGIVSCTKIEPEQFYGDWEVRQYFTRIIQSDNTKSDCDPVKYPTHEGARHFMRVDRDAKKIQQIVMTNRDCQVINEYRLSSLSDIGFTINCRGIELPIVFNSYINGKLTMSIGLGGLDMGEYERVYTLRKTEALPANIPFEQ